LEAYLVNLKAKQSFDQHFNTTKEQIDALVKEIETSQTGLKARVGYIRSYV
jgi:hypothetical protein